MRRSRFSEGARLAGCEVVWAANHWKLAVHTHQANHPTCLTICQDLHQARWRSVPRCDLLLASPQCTGHSRARGTDQPMHEEDRATAWSVVTAVEVLRPPVVIVENVLEFQRWELFTKWHESMEVLGYRGVYYTLDAADFGVPQHRLRVFMVYSRAPLRLKFKRARHVAASTVINFDDGRWSRISKDGRADATITRISAGREVYGDRFLVAYYGNAKGGRSLDRPIVQAAL